MSIELGLLSKVDRNESARLLDLSMVDKSEGAKTLELSIEADN